MIAYSVTFFKNFLTEMSISDSPNSYDAKNENNRSRLYNRSDVELKTGQLFLEKLDYGIGF